MVEVNPITLLVSSILTCALVGWVSFRLGAEAQRSYTEKKEKGE